MIFHESPCKFTIGFPIIMKISPKPRPNFCAARIDGRFFRASGLLVYTSDNFRIHSLWENYADGTGERFRALFRSSNFFVIKYYWNRVVTYLWERDIVSLTSDRYKQGRDQHGAGLTPLPASPNYAVVLWSPGARATCQGPQPVGE